MARGRKPNPPVQNGFDKMGDNAATVLRDYVKEIEDLQEKKHEIANQIKDVLNKARSNGFPTGPLKAVLRVKAQEDAVRIAFQQDFDRMKKALGIMDLFEYAESKDATGNASEKEADAEVNASAPAGISPGATAEDEEEDAPEEEADAA